VLFITCGGRRWRLCFLDSDESVLILKGLKFFEAFFVAEKGSGDETDG
jgi:hypothetical protein